MENGVVAPAKVKEEPGYYYNNNNSDDYYILGRNNEIFSVKMIKFL